MIISKEKRPIERKCGHWASFLDTRNRISNARENPFPKGRGLSLLASYVADIATFWINSLVNE